MKKYIFGNLKMHFNLKQTEEYLENFLPKVESSKNEIVLCPSFVNLMFTGQKLTSTKVLLGAQNVASEASGAYTGEVSASMLKSVGATYVLVGHSERKKYFLEKNETINKKIQECLGQGLKVVLCVGESKYERANKKHKQSLEKQLCECLKGLYDNELKNIIIAYEPIYSIGSGVLPKAKEVEEAVSYIRSVIQAEFSEKTASSLKILYGGSVNAENVKTFAGIKGVNGLLVGGASIKPDEFAKVCNI
ncbi:MAG: triose-phosphate isomerase [Clostridiales bacterium]|nr:triose-phosphate isomerase [Clostridiales bacterium]